MKEKIVATLIIRDANLMTPYGSELLAKWIKEQAEYFLIHSRELSKRFRATYTFPEE